MRRRKQARGLLWLFHTAMHIDTSVHSHNIQRAPFVVLAPVLVFFQRQADLEVVEVSAFTEFSEHINSGGVPHCRENSGLPLPPSC